MLKSLLPIKLSRDDSAYKTVDELAEVLRHATSVGDIKNIALTGPFGSGKSSVLHTLMENHKEFHFLPISLATLQANQEGKEKTEKKSEVSVPQRNNSTPNNSRGEEKPKEKTEEDLMKEHGSYPHNPLIAEVMFQAGYIEKFGTGITENIRKMQEAHLLAPDIDLSTEFVTTIWRENDETSATNGATSAANRATSAINRATSALDENKRIIDGIVVKKVKAKMTSEELIACIVEACIVEHSVDELGTLLNKTSKYLSDRFIPQLVEDGILLPTKPRHSSGQTYITNPKYKNSK